jgi:hypothetical protein
MRSAIFLALLAGSAVAEPKWQRIEAENGTVYQVDLNSMRIPTIAARDSD